MRWIALVFLSLQCHAAPIDFDSALERMYVQTPALNIAATDIEIKEAEEWQASKRPNPELSVEFQHSWNYSSATITQPFEIGGKRTARMRVASTATCIEEWNREILQADLRLKLRNAFIDAAAAQEKFRIATEQLKCASEAFAAPSKSKIQKKKAETNQTSCHIALRKAEAEFSTAKAALANLWGDRVPDFSEVDYSLEDVGHPPSLEVLKIGLEQSPEVNKGRAELANAYEALSLEKANRIPNLSLGVGYNPAYNNASNDIGIIATIDLPLFDRNQGNIAKARAGISRAEYVFQDMMQALQAKLLATYAQMQAAYEEAILTKETLLPGLEETYKLTQEEHQKDNADLSDVQDAQKALLDASSDYIDKLADYHHHMADLERLGEENDKE